MRGYLFVLSALAAASIALAGCPNACSGKGVCGANDECQCWDNFVGADCSERLCPFGLAFVDIPRGDLNHNGAIEKPSSGVVESLDFTTETLRRKHFLVNPKGYVKVDWANSMQYEYFPLYTGTQGFIEGTSGGSTVNLGGLRAQEGEAHFPAECSAKGVCARSSGTCECFEGYTGAACQRSMCPNQCSGHGSCLTLREIAGGSTLTTATRGRNYRAKEYFKTYTKFDGVDQLFDYNLWDADKQQACVCDAGFTGADCSARECPMGKDPLTSEDWFCGNSACAAEVQAIYIRNRNGQTDTDVRVRLGYTDVYGDADVEIYSKEFTLSAGLDAGDYADIVRNALDTFPNSLLSGVAVNVSAYYDNSASAVSTSAYPQLINLDGDGDVVELRLDFTHGPQGDVNAIKLHQLGDATSTDIEFGSTHADSSGTTTISTGTNTISSATIFTGQLTPSNGNTPYSTCSNRGLCDRASGICNCFAGFFGSACELQNALAS